MQLKRVQPVLAFAAAHLDEDLSLEALAHRASLSPFHLHRMFSAAAGETPKQFALRLRLERAAVMLLAGHDSVLDVALACGFQSHEVFSRAFRRRFQITPSAYRERGFVAGPDRAQSHAALVEKIGPCIGLYHFTGDSKSPRSKMTYSITKKDLSPQPVLVVRRRIERSAIAATIGEALPHVFVYAQRNGLALTGLPFTRYIDVGPGLITIEPGIRVAASGQHPDHQDPGEGEVRADTLPSGPVAMTTHVGPYDKLSEAYAAIQQWIETEGLIGNGAPCESYVNDPSDYPDPKDWKTEVFWPLAG